MKPTKRVKESGYALLSLLVAMTISLVLLVSMTAKPSAQFVGQRENEEEAFYRAYQVSNAIKRYAEIIGGGNMTVQSLPTKLDDLLDKFTFTTAQGVSEQYIVRKSAMIDPLTGTEWKPVRLGDPKVKEFARTYIRVMAEQQALALASGAGANPGIAGPQQNQMPPLLMFAAQAAGITNLNAKDDKDEEEGKSSTGSGFSLGMDSDSRPIVGIMSSLKKPMIRNYYTIDTYEKAIFIAGVQIPGLPTVVPGGMGGQGGATFGQGGQEEPDGRPKFTGGQCPPGSTDPKCARNRVPNP